MYCSLLWRIASAIQNANARTHTRERTSHWWFDFYVIDLFWINWLTPRKRYHTNLFDDFEYAPPLWGLNSCVCILPAMTFCWVRTDRSWPVLLFAFQSNSVTGHPSGTSSLAGRITTDTDVLGRRSFNTSISYELIYLSLNCYRYHDSSILFCSRCGSYQHKELDTSLFWCVRYQNPSTFRIEMKNETFQKDCMVRTHLTTTRLMEGGHQERKFKRSQALHPLCILLRHFQPSSPCASSRQSEQTIQHWYQSARSKSTSSTPWT